MTSSDFLNLAVRLSNSSHEADLRTSVSRAYYGAYHAVLEFLRSCGVNLPPSPDSHKKVRWFLDEAGYAAASLASRHLDSLRTDRNEADYDLLSHRFRTRSDVAMSVQGAKDVVDALALCATGDGGSSLRENVRKYATDVLKIPIDEL